MPTELWTGPVPLSNIISYDGFQFGKGGDPWYDVKAFGAKGDGVANDALACQNAIAACQNAGGGIVYFPTGTYLLQSILVINTQNVILQGAGRYATTLLSGAPGLGSVTTGLITFTANSGSLRHLSIKGRNVAEANAFGLMLYPAAGNIFDFTALDIEVTSMGATGIYAHSAQRCRFISVRSGYNWSEGLFLDQSTTRSVVIGCNIDNNQNNGIDINGYRNIIQGTVIDSNALGGGNARGITLEDIANVAQTASYNKIIGCEILNHKYGIGITDYVTGGTSNVGNIISGCVIDCNNIAASVGITFANLAPANAAAQRQLITNNQIQNAVTGIDFSNTQTTWVTVADNDFAGLTNSLNLAGMAATYQGSLRIRNNRGINPADISSYGGSPGVPATTTVLANPFGFDATIYLTAGASTCTVAITGISGIARATYVLPANGVGSVRIAAGDSITLTYTSVPTWNWILD